MVEPLEDRLAPAAFFVRNTNDSGPDSLRQAILDSNNTADTNRILFSIGTGPQTIALRSALPAVQDHPVTIDGTSQPGYAGTPLIELNGSSAGVNASGLRILAGNSSVLGLVINRFPLDGIEIQGSDADIIQGNYIGTDVTGTLALGNGRQGILVNTGGNTIGGTASGAGNLISGNRNDGLQLAGAAAIGNVVQGNLIGTDASGTRALGNGRLGILINFAAANNTIGGTMAGAGNVIAANNNTGLQIADPNTTGSLVEGNQIGTDLSGAKVLGNAGAGIVVNNNAANNTIGGTTAGAGNTIAFNHGPGVAVLDAATAGISIESNAIYNNDGLGIDLGWDGVTVNHAGGSSTGPNHWQNYPVLQTASPGDSTAVTGTLNGLANSTLTLDFYASSAPDLSFFGQGQRYLGPASVSTDASGNASFSLTLAAATGQGEWLTATATDAAGNTSEFAGALALPATGLGLNSTTWVPIGPAPIAVSPLFNPPIVAGRVSVAAPDPTNPNIMYIGADGGGVWKTTDWLDPSPIWTPLTDSQASLNFNNNSYQPLAVFSGDPSIVYAAMSGPGGGVLKSTDGGATWTLLANSLFDRVYFSTLVVSPNDANTLYVGVRFGNIPWGLYESSDGGQTWVNRTARLGAGSLSDVVMDPTNPLVLYAGLVYGSGSGATNGIYKTTDGGATWVQLKNGLPAGSTIGSGIRLALAPSDPQTVYATIFNRSSSLPLRYRTANGGASWSRLNAVPGDQETRYWHAVLAVDPNNPQVVYANGAGVVFESTDSGLHWTPLYSEDPIGVFSDDTGALVLVGDRGIYRWAGPGNAFASKQGNLQVSQLYTLTLDPSNPSIAYGVAQDHFRALKFSGYPVWNYLGTPPGDPANAGETGKILVDPRNGNRVYAYVPNDSRSLILRSDDGGATWIEKGSGISVALAGFGLAYTAQKAFRMDPSNPDRLLVGTDRVYETTNDGDSWTAISPVLSAGQYLTALAIAPGQPNMIYAATSDGHVFVSPDDGQTWQEEDQGLPRDPSDAIVDIEVDPGDANRAFVVPGTFPTSVEGSSHVWMTTTGGNSWAEITGNLPPTYWTNALVADWRFPTPVLYVGTARGVYTSADLGTTWTIFGQALPNAVVTDLQFLPQFGLLAAATYGRGVFEILAPPPPGPVPASFPLGYFAFLKTMGMPWMDHVVGVAVMAEMSTTETSGALSRLAVAGGIHEWVYTALTKSNFGCLPPPISLLFRSVFFGAIDCQSACSDNAGFVELSVDGQRPSFCSQLCPLPTLGRRSA